MLSRVCFTWSWCGWCLEFADGSREQVAAETLAARIGPTAYGELSRVARVDGFCGMFYQVPAHLAASIGTTARG